VSVAVGGTGVDVGVAVGGTGVDVGVAVGGTTVGLRVAVGVGVSVAVGGTGVDVGVAVGGTTVGLCVAVDGGVSVAAGGTGVDVGVAVGGGVDVAVGGAGIVIGGMTTAVGRVVAIIGATELAGTGRLAADLWVAVGVAGGLDVAITVVLLGRRSTAVLGGIDGTGTRVDAGVWASATGEAPLAVAIGAPPESPSGPIAWGSAGKSTGTNSLLPGTGVTLRASSSRAAAATMSGSSRWPTGPAAGQGA